MGRADFKAMLTTGKSTQQPQGINGGVKPNRRYDATHVLGAFYNRVVKSEARELCSPDVCIRFRLCDPSPPISSSVAALPMWGSLLFLLRLITAFLVTQ